MKAFTSEQVKALPLQVPLFTHYASIHFGTNSLGALHRYLKLGLFRSHSHAIKPLLTDANKYGRMKFAGEFVGSALELNYMLQYVHLDEKWFYTTEEIRKYYLVPGPPNSPDTNVLDLGFFAAVQSLQTASQQRTIDELVGHMANSFEEYPLERLNHTIVKLQGCLAETMKLFGDNAYKVPHVSKGKQERKGLLPQNVSMLAEARCVDELAQALEAMTIHNLWMVLVLVRRVPEEAYIIFLIRGGE
ncbi:hypothetical protein H257_14882 [Aphanomyces astaci]|uniref:Uncharacterized protein n=1 Tax=Aphanomyces astaci TaxID=112090 RepID=W4FPY1_APHAT|nr:hypothetical protein H257_14882 [Aphanomyces astaci]ETV69520.1 hypothetical protein H257_14882 [Aphanomyces astaci]|eukprot:XP_009841093.1 hypothetical protein H257_14882 [Aphanomyces astaci]